MTKTLKQIKESVLRVGVDSSAEFGDIVVECLLCSACGVYTVSPRLLYQRDYVLARCEGCEEWQPLSPKG